MANGYTVFFSYILKSNSGYSDAIHCNYINSTTIETLINKEVNINFEDPEDFKFLSVSGSSTGYSATKLFMLVQLINNSLVTDESEIKPISNKWKIYDVTHQILNYPTGSTRNISSIDITSTVFKVPIYLYNTMDNYDLTYIDYPNVNSENELCFGDEQYFFGNVTTDVEAIAYTTDLAINMPLNQFNTSNNATWNTNGVYISEIGIYDTNKNLVAIGKLNNPVFKDPTISRTIVFAIDF
jgi:hypothetical protein